MSNGRLPKGGQRGQAIPEYVGAVLLVAAVFGAILTIAGPLVPGGGLARAIASKLICAVGAGSNCGPLALADQERSPTERAYGTEVAAMLAKQAPDIYFEDDDFASLPVDFSECRQRSCADSTNPGHVRATQTGLPPTAYLHVVDCRDPLAAAAEGYDCSGERVGNVYLQYWLYYPDSATHGFGSAGYHLDDWESFQVRVDPGGGALARASSHHSYNGRSGGIGSVASDAGWEEHSGWDTILNTLHVAAGSHAGMTMPSPNDSREIPRADLQMIPAEPIAAAGDAPDFSISPPWEKGVWDDPEDTGT